VLLSGLPGRYKRTRGAPRFPGAASPTVTATNSPRVCLFGASPTTRNLGVSALFHSTVAGLFERAPGAQVTVFDHGRGERELAFETRGKQFTVRCLGAHHSRRYWRGDSLGSMRWIGRFGVFGNRNLRAIAKADAVLDLSGGDSFTDLYGPKRFWGVSLPKLIALEQGTPLVLPPQTYGPFQDEGFARIAGRIVRGAARCWARDPRSLEVLHGLLGNEPDPARHRLGVDVAFALERRTPAEPLSPTAEAWLGSGGGPVIGLNVSGLVWLDPQRGPREYGFRADYRAAMEGFLRRLLDETDARVVLVPHVLAPAGHYESDPQACAELAAGHDRERVTCLTGDYGVTEVKQLIGRLDWFCGTRMHATIGALSSGVPAAAVAYSPKFQGIFETCDQAAGVADPTRQDTGQLIDSLLEAYHDRDQARARLANALPPVLAAAATQADELAAVCTGSAPPTPHRSACA
jgi:colanic acid/amylovoran biosynthesis protein WcaK/AmsJ